MTPIELIVGFLLGILGSYIATATQPPIPNPWQRHLEDSLAEKEALRKALTSGRSFREEVRSACSKLSQDRALLGNLSEQEHEIWLLLGDPRFQDDLIDWLMVGAIDEGREIRARLEGRMEGALLRGGATSEQIAVFKAEYFERIDRAIFSDPVLAAWRHQLSLDYLREQVTAVRRAAEQAAGIYSPEQRQAALERYYTEALNAWDIVDLSNLPEGDIQIATQKLLLRQLYMPLRVTVEISREQASDDAAFGILEEGRTARRLREAGRIASREQRERAPVGARLDRARRLVVLGDPGGGKTTLLRWMATAYLLRERDENAYRQIPDIETLPDEHWLPVLVRCRDFGETDLCRSFVDFLAQHLLKSELHPEEARVMTAVILERIAAGRVLLLVDGLDEITNPRVRVQFCQEAGLLDLLKCNEPLRCTGAWALWWLCEERLPSFQETGYVWQPNRNEVRMLIEALQTTKVLRRCTIRWLVNSLGNSKDILATEPLINQLDYPDTTVQWAVVCALGQLGDRRAVKPLLEQLGKPDNIVREAVAIALGQLENRHAVKPLLALLDDPEIGVQQAAIVALARLGNPRGRMILNNLFRSDDVEERSKIMRAFVEGHDDISRQLLSRNLNAYDPWLDPQQSITNVRVTKAAEKLHITPEHVRARYEALAEELPLMLEWRTEGGK